MSNEVEELADKIDSATTILATIVHDLEAILAGGPSSISAHRAKIEIYDRWLSGELYAKRAADLEEGDKVVIFGGEGATCLGTRVSEGDDLLSFGTSDNGVHCVSKDSLVFLPVDQADKAKT